VPRTRSEIVDRLCPLDLEMFWDRIATSLPLVEQTETPGEVVVTFCWRDAEAEAVLLFVNRLTDERNLADTLLEREEGTDLWHASFRMGSDWRASYSFLVQRPGEIAPWVVEGQVALRAALDRGQRDPRNPDVCVNRAGITQSVVSLPDAPPQPWLAARPDVASGTVTFERGPDGREVWLYDPPGVAPDAALPLVVAFDGEVWTGQQSLPTTLDNLLADGCLRPVRAALISSGGTQARWAELGGSDGAAYVVEQLVPWVRSRRSIGDEVVVVGQSLGGLTALRAGLTYPETVTAVASQSASLWMDDLDTLLPTGPAGGLAGRAPRIQLAHGSQEWVLAPLHEDLARRLAVAGVEITTVAYNGGHDYAWWRGAVADALRALLAPQPRPGKQ